ncbi:MAG: nucleotidyl transferase AbiEii/AbiGii toxin family protein [Kiritimatiellae bacterium]|nr:nucleotidyl transferase AbiEii/AbiGii toxin family protein [Kiritimatiellia bacterium]
MHDEVLNRAQTALLPLMAQFRREYYLVGGTAIALYIGHRRSVDFDLFKQSAINHKKNLDKIAASGFDYIVTRRVHEQMNLIVDDVKLTFSQYPFTILPDAGYNDVFRIPSLLTLAAMKAYALGRRSKWKDYVDLYFLLTRHFTLEEVVNKALEVFGDMFSEKLFRAQLSYFSDVDYTEKVEYLMESPPADDAIRMELTRISLKGVVD